MKVQSWVFTWSLVVFYCVLSLSRGLKPAHAHSSTASNDVRLVGKGNRCAGELRFRHEAEWRPLYSRNTWKLKEASVVCRQLDCGSAVSVQKVMYPRRLLHIWRFYSDCDGSERALVDCGTVKKAVSSSTTEVICSDVLPPPDISLYTDASVSSPSGNQTQGVVFKGLSFTISCSVEPRYGGGYFTLGFTGVHLHRSWTQTAFNYSANFWFKNANQTHEGTYRCVYHNTVYGHNVSSEGERLSLTVKDDWGVILDDGALGHGEDHVACAGKLLINNGNQTKPVSAESAVWDLEHAIVVCRQLGCGAAVSTKAIDLPNKTPMWRFFSDCIGYEFVLMECGVIKPWLSSSVVQVTCAGAAGKRRARLAGPESP